MCTYVPARCGTNQPQWHFDVSKFRELCRRRGPLRLRRVTFLSAPSFSTSATERDHAPLINRDARNKRGILIRGLPLITRHIIRQKCMGVRLKLRLPGRKQHAEFLLPTDRFFTAGLNNTSSSELYASACDFLSRYVIFLPTRPVIPRRTGKNAANAGIVPVLYIKI